MGVSPVAIRKAKSRVLRRLREETGDIISYPNPRIHALSSRPEYKARYDRAHLAAAKPR